MSNSNTVFVQINNLHIDVRLFTQFELGNLEVEDTPELRALLTTWEKVESTDLPADEDVGCTNVWRKSSDVEEEKVFSDKLNEMVEIQERMAKGMRIINEASTAKEKALQQYLSAKEQGLIYTIRNKAWEIYSAHKERVSKLWAHWHTLKDECCGIADTDTRLWPAYFQLVNTEFNTYWTSGETEEVDMSNVYGSEFCPTSLDALDEIEKSSREEDSLLEDVSINLNHWRDMDRLLNWKVKTFRSSRALEEDMNSSLVG